MSQHLSCTRGGGWLGGALFIGAGLALAGCAAEPSRPAAPAPGAVAPGAPTSGAAPAEPKPQSGGKVQIATDRPIQQLLLYEDSSSDPSVYLQMVYEPLVRLNLEPYPKDWRDHLRVIPHLAESWQQTDPTTYVFKIRKGVKWHDGVDFTAEDVVWSYEFLRDPQKNHPTRSFIAGLATVRALDPLTLEVKSQVPDYRFLNSLADLCRVCILPRHVYAAGGDVGKTPVGTGPYKLKAWTPKVEITHVRNDTYWGDRPYLDEIRHVTNLDRAGVTAAFIAKQSDLIQLPDKPQAEAIARAVPDATMEGFVRDLVVAIFMKLDRPPFNDIRVRKAVHLVFDRQGMNDILWAGLGAVNPPSLNGRRADWAVPQEELLKLPGYRSSKDQDIAEAKRLLTEAGYASGLKFTMRVDARHSTAPSQAQVLAEQLNKAGIDAKLDVMERGAFRKALADGEFDMILETEADWDPTLTWLENYSTGGSTNRMPISDPALDALVQEHLQSLDPAKHKETALKIQRLLMDKLYTIPTLAPTSFSARQPWIHGWATNYGGGPRPVQWYTIWVEKEKLPPGR